jgi:hypothetical protein
MADLSRASSVQKLRRRITPRRLFAASVMTILPAVLVAGAVAFADVPDDGVFHACIDKDSGRLRIVDNKGCQDGERKITWNAKGSEGGRGEAGPAGARGGAGPAGVAGATGDTGAVGPQGPIGPIGGPGERGPMGADGPAGPQGLVGPDGPAGPQGLAGPSGPRGPSGPQGVEGPAGPQGPRGPAGMSGFEIVTARTPVSGLNSEGFKQATAQCRNGQRVVGTAANIEGDAGELAGRIALQAIYPLSQNEARGAAAEVAPGTNLRWALVAVAFCADTP